MNNQTLLVVEDEIEIANAISNIFKKSRISSRDCSKWTRGIRRT